MKPVTTRTSLSAGRSIPGRSEEGDRPARKWTPSRERRKETYGKVKTPSRRVWVGTEVKFKDKDEYRQVVGTNKNGMSRTKGWTVGVSVAGHEGRGRDVLPTPESRPETRSVTRGRDRGGSGRDRDVSVGPRRSRTMVEVSRHLRRPKIEKWGLSRESESRDG